ncbi:ATP-binding cassette sub- A member 5 [Nowakowskiella sp. JEL0078]|nr:ATP-binding cassette sub- A member 5 [Nowakowskiella sp. JEL0078]
MLQVSLFVKPEADPTVNRLPTLTSICSSCIHIGYVNSSNIDPIIKSLASLLSESESPSISIQSFSDLNTLNNFHAYSPAGLLAGINFLNVSAATATTSGNASLGLNQYQIYVNESSWFLDSNGPINSGYTTVLAYVERALQNAFREARGLPPFRSPLAYSDINGIGWAKFSVRGSSGFLVFFVSIYFAFMFYVTQQNLIQRIARDKEKLIKHGLVMMGLGETTYLFAIVASETAFNFPAIFLATLLFFVGQLLQLSSWPLFLLLLIVFLPGHMFQAAFLSIFVQQERLAGGFGFLILIASLALHGVGLLTVYASPAGEILFMLAMPVVAMARAVHLFKSSEVDNGVGITFANATELGVTKVAVMLVVDIFFWAFLAWYGNTVMPGQNIPNQKLGFLFSSAYWNPSRAVSGVDEEAIYGNDVIENENVETVDLTGLKPEERGIIRVRDVTKVFKIVQKKKENEKTSIFNLKKPIESRQASDHISLDLHSGSCLALLGHNGAGKSTLINMISGNQSPTSGSLTVRLIPPGATEPITIEASNRATAPLLRVAMGVCPQFDCLFPAMTASEHIHLIAAIKGVNIETKTLNEYVEALLVDVGLEAKLDQFVDTLSGGQRRKVSLAMALCGNPQKNDLKKQSSSTFVQKRLEQIEKEQKLKELSMIGSDSQPLSKSSRNESSHIISGVSDIRHGSLQIQMSRNAKLMKALGCLRTQNRHLSIDEESESDEMKI